MLGCDSGFQALEKHLALTSKSIHCMPHKQVLAPKILPDLIRIVSEQMIQIINFIKAEAVNSGVFKRLCIKMDSDAASLLYTISMAF